MQYNYHESHDKIEWKVKYMIDVPDTAERASFHYSFVSSWR
jgi:hypothetical protein